MSQGAYLLGAAQLLFLVGALGLAAYRVRMLLAPELSRSPARLAEAVLALALFTVIAELLGAVGLLKQAPLLLGAAGAAGLAEAASRRRAGPRTRAARAPVQRTAGLLALAGCLVAAIVAARWLIPVQGFLAEGMWAFDTMAYHMPFAASFAQSGSVTAFHYADPIDVVWFYPANSELLHAGGIVLLDRDILSPLINLGWLALAMLAVWCIGRPYGAAPASLASAGILLLSPLLLARQPGNAHSDIAGIALLLASAAVLVSAYPGEARRRGHPDPAEIGVVVVAALAAGLAIGTKLSLVGCVAALTVGVLVVTAASARRRVAAAWFLPLLATGAFWYLRNLIATGNPLPFFDRLGPIDLPAPERVVEVPGEFSFAHYLGDDQVWDRFLSPGLEIAFGPLWPIVLTLAVVGGIAALLDQSAPIRRVLGATVLVGVLAYLFTPRGAAGPEGSPVYFAVNLRYVAPALALGLALLPTLRWARDPVGRYLLYGVVGFLLVHTAGLGVQVDDDRLGWALAIALAGAGLVLGFALMAWRMTTFELAATLGLVVVLAVGVYWRPADDYLDQRYTAVWPGLSVTESFAWAREVSDARIALGGTTAAFLQYAYYGTDASNVVEYVGRRGPRAAFNPIESCEEWRETLNRGDYDYLVTSPTIVPGEGLAQSEAPERSWVGASPAAGEIVSEGPVSVFELNGPLDPEDCGPAGSAFEGLPPRLRPHER